jgi:hypothetical protein
MMGANQQMGARAMGLYVLDAVLRMLEIRGHIPQHGDFSAGRGESPFAANTSTPMRVLAAIVSGVACVTLAVWLAHKLL